jgi:hypothetical protein
MADEVPEAITDQILQFSESSMGAHRVKVVLPDGREYLSVYVARGEVVVRVGTSETITSDPSLVVAVANRSH